MFKKNICIKLIIIFLMYLFIMVLFSFKSNYCRLAPDEEYIGMKIPITVTLSGNPTDNETVFKYEIKPDGSNVPGVENEVKEISVVVKKDDPRNMDGSISKTVYLDFSETVFPMPAVYKYTISEVYCSNEKEYHLSDQKYKFSIEVFENADNTLGHSIYRYASDLNNNTKEDRLVFHHNNMTYLKIKLFSKGKMAKSDEYFRVTVSIFGSEGDIYNIVGQDKIVTYNGEKIRTIDSFKVANGNYSFDVYLKDNQTIFIGSKEENGKVLYQIPVGTYVSIIENDARKYQTFINSKEGKVIRNFCLSSYDEENTFEILNQAEFDVAITGVDMSVMPYIVFIVILVAIAIFIILNKRKKDKKEDEDN